jgi:hypothetical protein
LAVNRSRRLLSPGLVEIARINPIEPKFVDEPHYDGFSSIIIAGYRQSDPTWCAFRLAQL